MRSDRNSLIETHCMASDYTISIMLRSCVIARWEGSVLMLSVEAAGNNEPLSRAPGLQARRGAQDFRRGGGQGRLFCECLGVE